MAKSKVGRAVSLSKPAPPAEPTDPIENSAVHDALEDLSIDLLLRLHNAASPRLADRRLSMKLGVLLARQGAQASDVVLAYQRLRRMMIEAMFRQLAPSATVAPAWHQPLEGALEQCLLESIEAYERERMDLTGSDTARDALTGTYNRLYFERRLPLELQRAARYQHPLALLLVEVDARPHDVHGYRHPLGTPDVAVDVSADDLQLVGRVLQETLRVHDAVARFSARQFVVMLPETPIAGARACARRLLTALDRQLDRAGRDSAGAVVAIGVAVYPDHGETAEALLASAWHALETARDHEARLALA